MTIDILLSLAKPTLPLDYRPAFVSLIKAALSRFYPEDYKELYQSGAVQKSFTFAVRLPSPEFSADSIRLSGEMLTLTIASSEDYSSVLLYNAFQKSVGYEHPLEHGNSMTVTSVSICPERPVEAKSVEIKFLSPLVVRRHVHSEPDKYYVFDDEEFSSCLNEIVSRQLGTNTTVRLEPIAAKKTVVRSFGSKVRVSVGVYILSAAPEAIRVLSAGGIGSRRSEGFGYFRILGVNA